MSDESALKIIYMLIGAFAGISFYCWLRNVVFSVLDHPYWQQRKERKGGMQI